MNTPTYNNPVTDYDTQSSQSLPSSPAYSTSSSSCSSMDIDERRDDAMFIASCISPKKLKVFKKVAESLTPEETFKTLVVFTYLNSFNVAASGEASLTIAAATPPHIVDTYVETLRGRGPRAKGSQFLSSLDTSNPDDNSTLAKRRQVLKQSTATTIAAELAFLNNKLNDQAFVAEYTKVYTAAYGMEHFNTQSSKMSINDLHHMYSVVQRLNFSNDVNTKLVWFLEGKFFKRLNELHGADRHAPSWEEYLSQQGMTVTKARLRRNFLSLIECFPTLLLCSLPPSTMARNWKTIRETISSTDAFANIRDNNIDVVFPAAKFTHSSIESTSDVVFMDMVEDDMDEVKFRETRGDFYIDTQLHPRGANGTYPLVPGGCVIPSASTRTVSKAPPRPTRPARASRAVVPATKHTVTTTTSVQQHVYPVPDSEMTDARDAPTDEDGDLAMATANVLSI